MAPFDLARARAETPGCAEVDHFNNAGAALMPRAVYETVQAHLERELLIGGYEAADEAEERLAAVYTSIARLINAAPDEIAVIENATRAWDMAFYSVPFRLGDRILTSVAEYASNYIPFLQMQQRHGVVVEVVPNDPDGTLDVAALERALERAAKLVAITHMPTNGGLVQPAAEIGRLARRAGALYLLDACQTVGQLPIDVAEIGCDMLSATSRKYLRGPRGMGFLYVRREALDRLDPVMLDLHAATWVAPDRYELAPGARRFENWETNVAAKLGMGAAIDYALGWGVAAIWDRVQALAATLRERLAATPGVQVRDQGRVRGGIVTFTVSGVPAPAMRAALRRERINVTVSRTASTRLDMEARELAELVRASVHYYNDDAEVERLVAAVAHLARGG